MRDQYCICDFPRFDSSDTFSVCKSCGRQNDLGLFRHFGEAVLNKMQAEEEEKYEKARLKIIDLMDNNDYLCLHKRCIECHGTGKTDIGIDCIHYISCPCKDCNPS